MLNNNTESGNLTLEDGFVPAGAGGCNNIETEAVCVSASGEVISETEGVACPWLTSSFGPATGDVPGPGGPNPPGNGNGPLNYGAAGDRGLWYKLVGGGCAANGGEANICIRVSWSWCIRFRYL